jgi:hypothetical protein
MPRGVTTTRVRRRQSDAKWRASVAMCYNIMKNVIPNQKKLGRRKVSKVIKVIHGLYQIFFGKIVCHLGKFQNFQELLFPLRNHILIAHYWLVPGTDSRVYV